MKKLLSLLLILSLLTAIPLLASCKRVDTELPVRFVLFQGLPKGDKLELIIQKTVELGAAEIVPVEMSRCVVKLDDKKKKSKQIRWQAIAESAATFFSLRYASSSRRPSAKSCTRNCGL